MSKAVFISHAVKNKDIADKLVDLLETGVGISDSDVFCSSLEGMGIPSGANFVSFIKDQVKEPKVVILLLSKEYFKSHFCLAELGASWVLSHRIIPIIVPPLERGDVKAVLTGIQLLKITEGSALNQMQEDIVNSLGIKGKAFARWESKRNKFVESIELIISSKEDIEDEISVEQYADINQKYSDAVSEIEIMEEEIEQQKALIDALKRAKNADEVSAIIEEASDDIEKFDNLVKEAKAQLSRLPEIVREAIYKHYRSEVLNYPEFGEDYKGQEIKGAVESDYLMEREDGLEIVEEDVTVSDAVNALAKLSEFVEEMNSEQGEFLEYYTNNYDHRLNFQSRRLWDEHLL